VPAAATGNNLECTGDWRANYFICDLSASGSSWGFSNERWTRNGVAYSAGDDQASVKYLCSPSGVGVGVTYTDSTGASYRESFYFFCPS
jgi:hypothetical protein